MSAAQSPFAGYLTLREAAQALGVHERTAAALIARGLLAAEKVFRVWLIREDAVGALLASGYTGRPGQKEL